MNKVSEEEQTAFFNLVYEHYKGGRYVYFGKAIQESDGTPLALYCSAENKTMYARPASEFFGDVTVDGVSVPRFRLISPNQVDSEPQDTQHQNG